MAATFLPLSESVQKAPPFAGSVLSARRRSWTRRSIKCKKYCVETGTRSESCPSVSPYSDCARSVTINCSLRVSDRNRRTSAGRKTKLSQRSSCPKANNEHMTSAMITHPRTRTSWLPNANRSRTRAPSQPRTAGNGDPDGCDNAGNQHARAHAKEQLSLFLLRGEQVFQLKHHVRAPWRPNENWAR